MANVKTEIAAQTGYEGTRVCAVFAFDGNFDLRASLVEAFPVVSGSAVSRSVPAAVVSAIFQMVVASAVSRSRSVPTVDLDVAAVVAAVSAVS